MKNTISILFFSLLIFSSCSTKTEDTYIALNKSAKLIIKNSNALDNIVVYSRYRTLFPTGYKYSDTLTISKQRESSLLYEIQNPDIVDFIINDTVEIPVFLVPGDSLYLSIEVTGKEKTIDNITFEGNQGSMNQYYIAKEKHFGNSLFKRRTNVQNPKYSLQQYKDSILTYIDIESNFLDSYVDKNNLPEWFMNYERAEILYHVTALLEVANYREKMLGLEVKVPDDYYDFLNSVPINNNSAIYSTRYYYFLSTLFFFRYTPVELLELPVEERFEKTLPARFELADSMLSKEVADVYKLFSTSNYAIKLNFLGLANTLIHLLDKSSFNKDYLAYLKDLGSDKFRLKENEIAPNFYLESNENKYYGLNDFYGKVVLLNFWFPGCMPCIKEIPYEKTIADELSKENFVLVNICLFVQKDNWLKTIKKHDMKGINLIAEGNWERLMIKNYFLAGYPHYVLIDPKGNVIKNKCKKPSEGLMQDILLAL